VSGKPSRSRTPLTDDSLFRAKLDSPASEIAARGHMLLVITAGCRVHVL
jgi:hypothetical protein